MKNFAEWSASVKENEVAVAQPDIKVDVDTIINSLETLANELTEELESTHIDEAGAVDFVKSWITSIKATNNQQKVNKIKMNAADLEFAANSATGDKKKILQDKSKAVNAQAIELQKMVDDRFSGKGGIVDRKLAKAKIEGQLQIIKRTSGMEDDPAKQSSLKDKMKELADRYKEENAAIAKLEDDNKAAIEAEKERLRKENEDASNANAQATKDAEDAATAQAAKDAADAPETKDAENAPETKDAEDAPETKETEDPKVKAAQDEITKLEQDLADAEASPDKNKQGIDVLKGAIAGKKKALQALKDKENPQESLVNRANSIGLNELATEIKSKFDWQVYEGTALYLKYNEIIKKTEALSILNENRYNDLSIKDRFSRLL